MKNAKQKAFRLCDTAGNPMLRLIAMVALTLLIGADSQGGPHWFSGPVKNPDASSAQSSSSESMEASSDVLDGTRLFDVIVSLHDDRDGDDDGNSQGGAGNAEQDTVEKTIQHFADAVYESTDRTHKIRKVRIFQNKKKHDVADIKWEQSGHPNATLSGITSSGGQIRHFDDFNGHNLLIDIVGSGYTLAHEWAHYAYGLRDEYPRKNSADVQVEPSIMSSQWRARSETSQILLDARWLNFSIAFQSDPPGPYQNTKLNRHHYAYGESCWETLARDNTFLENLTGFFSTTPVRPVYPELSEVAPAGSNDPSSTDLPGTARSDLDIIWMNDDLIYEIVIDRSGSMSTSSKIANAKTAARLLVDLAETGSTIGVSAFNSSVTNIVPLTKIVDDSTKNSIKSSINTITATGGTSIGAGAQAALNKLLAPSVAEGTKVVFLLSDGQSSDNALAPISAYQAAQIPIFSFSYGDDADTTTLGEMASETGGQLFISPSSLAAVTKAFQDANAAASSAVSVATGSNSAPASAEVSSPVVIDSTIGSMSITVTHPGTAASAIVEVVAPDGNRFAPNATSESGGECLKFFSIDNPISGSWQIVARGSGGEVPIEYQVSGVPTGASFFMAADVADDDRTINYPEPFAITARLEKELPIVNAVVEAVVTAPDGSEFIVAMNDDGVAPDEAGNDALYSGWVDYNTSGTYNVLIRATGTAGQAMQSEASLDATPGLDGFAVPPAPDEPIEEDFERFERFQVSVEGVVVDDHGNSNFSATSFTAENIDLIPGKIDYGGDVDFFEITVPFYISSIAVRVSGLSPSMDPRLRLFNSDGDLIAERTLGSAMSTGGFLSFQVDVAADQTLYAEVSHLDPDGTGLYEISAGQVLSADTVIPQAANSNAGRKAALMKKIKILKREIKKAKRLEMEGKVRTLTRKLNALNRELRIL